MKNSVAYIWVCIIAIISIFIEEHRQRPCVTQDGTMRVFDTYTNVVTSLRRVATLDSGLRVLSQAIAHQYSNQVEIAT